MNHYTYETTEAILEGLIHAGGGLLVIIGIIIAFKLVLTLPGKLFR